MGVGKEGWGRRGREGGVGKEGRVNWDRSWTQRGAIYSFANPPSPPHLYTWSIKDVHRSKNICIHSSWGMIEIRNPRGYKIGNRAFDDVDMYIRKRLWHAIVSNFLRPKYDMYVWGTYICGGKKALFPYFTEFLDSVPFGNAKRVKKEKIDVIMHGCMVITFTCSGRQELTNQLFVG